ncbi:MAG: glucose-6-phosphate isomerase [Candidatus Margulisiibacteriota bacterium]
MSAKQTRSWQILSKKAFDTVQKAFFLREEFERDPNRASGFRIITEKIFFDYSRQLVDKDIMSALLQLAEETSLKGKIEAMFSGQKINITEDRAVLHTALRNISGKSVLVDSKDVMPGIIAVLSKMKKFSKEVIAGSRKGITGRPFKNIVAIGIGGSYLGPEFLARACAPYAVPGMKLFFVANVDGTDFAVKTAGLDREETLFVIVSKTFTTAETMKNASAAKRWMAEKLGEGPDVIKKHFVAVSTAADKVKAFGIDTENMFGFWDFVGGRFSATSAVGGVPLSLYLGYDNFLKILEGANWMDVHYRTAPLSKNIPVISALMDIWNINFMDFKTRAILPYSQAYCKYAPHCQQTEMESNGKSVLIDGTPVDFETGEVVFGEPGTNGQHSFYQLLHQGTTAVPADFIGFLRPQYDIGADEGISHHDELMTNLFAQPDALAFGQDNMDPHKQFPGNRPSSVFLLAIQDPFSAGVLLSLLENRVATKGFVWGINSFDQFGVELGKKLGLDIRKRMELFKQNPADTMVYVGLNSSTAELLKMYLSGHLSI